MRLSASALLALLLPSVAHVSHAAAADRLAPLRFAGSASLGALVVRPDPPIALGANGYDPVPFSAGVGVEGRLGVQIAPWLAVDALVFGESALLAADARAALLLEIAPARVFAIGLGAGVGAMWTANFLHPSPSANFAFALARAEARPFARLPNGGELVLGLEGLLGRTHRGSVPEGTQILGGRAYVGILFR